MPDSDEVDLGPGTLLISAPMMQDPNFRRSVVLLCEHNDREGTFGLILNRELDVHLGDVLDEYLAYDPPLYMGGPVQRETLHFLHTRDDIPGGVGLPGDVTWGGDFEVVQQVAKGGDAAPENLRFFLGYAGWGPGQLEGEIGEEAWIPAPGAAADLLFDTDPGQLWRTILRRMGGEYAVLANFPDDPRMN